MQQPSRAPNFADILNTKKDEDKPDFASILPSPKAPKPTSAVDNPILRAAQLKGPEEPEEPKGVFKVIDILQRPNFAIAGAVKALAEGEDVKGVVKEAGKGFFGKERDTFSDVLNTLGWTHEGKVGRAGLASKVGRGVTGFALDVLTDPLTYTGVSALTKAGKLAEGVGKLAPTAARQAKLGQRALIQFMGKELVRGEKVFEKSGQMLDFVRASNIGDRLGNSFIPNFRPASVDPEIWKRAIRVKNAAKNAKIFRETEAADKATKIYVLLNKYMKEATDVDLSKLLTAIEKPSSKMQLDEGLQEIATLSREYLDELSTIRSKAGKSIIDQDDFKYLPHVHKQDFVNDLKNLFGKARVNTTSSPADQARKVFKFIDDGGNELLGTADEFKLTKTGDDAFKAADGTIYNSSLPTIEEKLAKYPEIETSLPNLMSVAGRRAANLEQGSIYFDEIADLSVNMGGVDTFTKLDDAIPVKINNQEIPELKGRVFHPELAREIVKVFEKLTNKKEVDDVVKLYDKTQNLWKASATFVNPAFHSRNAVSNIWQNWIGGVKSPISYSKATLIQSYLSEGKVTGSVAKIARKVFGDIRIDKLASKLDDLVRRYWDDYNQQGLIQTFFESDIERGIQKQIEPRLLQATERVGGVADAASRAGGRVFQAGANVGNMVETNARLTHFIDKIDKGFIPEEAAKSVKKFLFDYTELTDVEREVFKRIVPFYTWSRKNIPLQLQAIVNKPRFAVGIGKAKANIEKQVGIEKIDQSVLPEWLKKSEPIVLGEEDGQIKVAKLEGYIPLTDIGLLSPSEIGRQTLGMVSPFIKFLPQAVANYNFFLEREVERFPGEKKDLLRMKVNPYLDFALRNIRPINELDKLIGKPHNKVSGKAKLTNFLFGGKIYHIDIARQKRINNFLRRKRAGTLKAAAIKAKKQGDIKEFKRLIKLRQETLINK